MIIVLKGTINKEQYDTIKDYIIKRGARVHESKGIEKSLIGVIGDKRDLD